MFTRTRPVKRVPSATTASFALAHAPAWKRRLLCFRGLAGFPRTMQLLGRSKCLSAYQFAGSAMGLKIRNHLKYGRQSLMSTEIGAVGSGFRHVGDNVIDLKTRCEHTGTAQARDRRERLLQVRFASNRSVYKRLNAEFMDGLVPQLLWP